MPPKIAVTHHNQKWNLQASNSTSGWGVVLAVFLLDFAVSRRAWCGSLCPVGAFYSLLGIQSAVRINAYQREQCDDCMDCFLVCPEQHIIKNPLNGANKGFHSLITSSQCTNCGRCIDVCTEDVFRFETRVPFKKITFHPLDTQSKNQIKNQEVMS